MERKHLLYFLASDIATQPLRRQHGLRRGVPCGHPVRECRRGENDPACPGHDLFTRSQRGQIHGPLRRWRRRRDGREASCCRRQEHVPTLPDLCDDRPEGVLHDRCRPRCQGGESRGRPEWEEGGDSGRNGPWAGWRRRLRKERLRGDYRVPFQRVGRSTGKGDTGKARRERSSGLKWGQTRRSSPSSGG